MKKISREQWDELRKANLIKYRVTKDGRSVQEPNFYICNKTHKGARKTYYVVEEKRILNFLRFGNKDNNRYNGYGKKPYRKNKGNYDKRQVYQENR